MALNLIECNRLVYHDTDGYTLEVDSVPASLNFNTELDSRGVELDRDAVETLRDCLTRWLETGKFTLPTDATEHYNVQAREES